jgi:uncharacterized protein (TIGR02118 family)
MSIEMMKLVNKWHIPDEQLPDETDRHYLNIHVPLARQLPGIRRHVVLKASVLTDPDHVQGWPVAHPSYAPYWRREDLWFDSPDDLHTAVGSAEWTQLVQQGVLRMVAGLQTDLFEVEEEYFSPGAFRPGQAPTGTVFGVATGEWHIPNGRASADVDRNYFAVHVPMVRGLPGVHRHLVLKGTETPDGVPARFWRGAETWCESQEAFQTAVASPERLDDRFAHTVAGLVEPSFFRAEEEWVV